ncbi:MAG: right-handed parallel beta-helix repeat-containing protein [Candidatus Thorarchaeota archaeon]
MFRSGLHVVIAIGLILVLTLPSSVNNDQVEFGISDTPIDEFELSLIESGALNFTSNNDFALQGLPGIGSIANPYRIENLSIVVDGDCISIENTTAHVVISNCFLSSNTTDSGSGVFLLNVTNCRIVNCYIENKNYGITLHRFTMNCDISGNQIRYSVDSGIYSVCAAYCTISENIITNCFKALDLIGGGGYSPRTSFFNISYNTLRYNSYNIYMNAAYSCLIDNNLIEDGAIGIYGHLDNMTITNNVIDDMTHMGIDLGSEELGLIQYNQFTNIGGTGIYLFGAENLTVSHNLFEYCGTGIYSYGDFMIFEWNNISYCIRGVELQDCHDCILRNNIITDNEWYAIYASASTFNNSFYYNTFSNNLLRNARDNGDNNIWDDSISRGNIWDDYIGFGTYTIPGYSGSVDRYPDNPEHGLQYHVILPPIGIGIICIVGIVLLYRKRDLVRDKLRRS